MSKSAVIKNSFGYTFGNLLLKAFSFFLIPLYTNYLSTEQYGILNLANNFISVVSMVFMMGLQYSVVRFFADYKNNLQKVAKMFGSIICFVLLVGIFLSSALIIFKNSWSFYFFENIPFYPIVFLAILISVVNGLYTVYQEILKGMQDAKRSILLTYLFFFLLLGSNICTVVFFKLGVAGILISSFGVYITMIIVMFVDLIKRKLFVVTIDKKILKRLLKYCLPIFPHTMAFTIEGYVIRLIISNKMSLSMLGIYSLSFQFGIISDVILNSVQSAFQPWLFNRLNDTDEQKVDDISQVSYTLMWIYGLFFILIGLFSQEAIILMANKSYVEAWVYVPFIVFSIAIKSPTYLYNNFLYYDKNKTKYVSYVTIVSSSIDIILTFLLVPYYGIWGVIMASIIYMVIRLGLILLIAYQDIKQYYSIIKLQTLSLAPMLFMGVALIPSYVKYYNSLSIVNIAYKICIFLLYVLLVGLSNKELIKKAYKKIIK